MKPYRTPTRAAAKETSLVVEAARQEEEAPQVLEQPRSQDLYPGLGKGPGNEVGTGSTSRTQSSMGMREIIAWVQSVGSLFHAHVRRQDVFYYMK